jgi:hypothetical protein
MAIASIRGLLFVLSLSILNDLVSSRYIERSLLTGTRNPRNSRNSLKTQLTGSIVLVQGQPFPRLIDATIDTLVTGLESKLFSSVDLVHVRLYNLIHLLSACQVSILYIGADGRHAVIPDPVTQFSYVLSYNCFPSLVREFHRLELVVIRLQMHVASRRCLLFTLGILEAHFGS